MPDENTPANETPTPDPAPAQPAQPPSGASALAEAALKAARDAVSALKSGVPPLAAAPAPEPEAQVEPDARSLAALAAAQAAIAQAKAAQGGSTVGATRPVDVGVAPAAFTPPIFTPEATPEELKGIDLLSDVNVNVKIELGRTRMLLEDVLRLAEGAVVELDKLAGDPVDVYVNGRAVARGEVLVLNDNFCVRINEILHHNDADGQAAQ